MRLVGHHKRSQDVRRGPFARVGRILLLRLGRARAFVECAVASYSKVGGLLILAFAIWSWQEEMCLLRTLQPGRNLIGAGYAM